jgi:hypothetical protein
MSGSWERSMVVLVNWCERRERKEKKRKGKKGKRLDRLPLSYDHNNK